MPHRELERFSLNAFSLGHFFEHGRCIISARLVADSPSSGPQSARPGRGGPRHGPFRSRGPRASATARCYRAASRARFAGPYSWPSTLPTWRKPRTASRSSSAGRRPIRKPRRDDRHRPRRHDLSGKGGYWRLAIRRTRAHVHRIKGRAQSPPRHQLPTGTQVGDRRSSNQGSAIDRLRTGPCLRCAYRRRHHNIIDGPLF